MHDNSNLILMHDISTNLCYKICVRQIKLGDNSIRTYASTLNSNSPLPSPSIGSPPSTHRSPMHELVRDMEVEMKGSQMLVL